MEPLGSLLYSNVDPPLMSSDHQRYFPSGENTGSPASCWSYFRFVSWTPAPPSGHGTSHISPAPRLRREVKCLRPTTHRPDGCRFPSLKSRKSSFVRAALPEPSGAIVQRLSPPPRSLVKRMLLPSGLQSGWCS